MRTKYWFAFAALTFICSTAPASATVTEFTSMAAFNAAVSGETTYNFEGIAPAGGYINVPSGGITVGGVTFSDNYPGNNAYVIDANAFYANYGASFFSGQSNEGGDTAYVNATLLSGVTAIGFSYGSYLDPSLPFTVTLSTGDIFNLLLPTTRGIDTDFVGFTSDTPITSVLFTLPGRVLAMDITQFEVGSAAPVPEPSTFLLIGAGLGGLALLKRRTRKQ